MHRSVGHRPNRLVTEKSPYLLQHANNPVNWFPWGSEAFEKAKNEDKPIFLSIGYSTCHWCHVMERESFEDPEVAELLNANFVCVKVDREQRPDIDSTYMRACQMMMGSGGWPLNLFLTPELLPFFAATYIPRESRFGRIGIKELISNISGLWEKRKEELLSSADEIVSLLRRGETVSSLAQEEILDALTLDEAYLYFVDNFDKVYGGFGGAPKFPSSHRLTFLLRYWKRTGRDGAIRMVEKTLDSMRCGGIYDHVGFGFHRYSIDRQWIVPHFEKMLYDQAMLTIAYVEAYQAMGEEKFKDTAREILTYVLRDMTDPKGGFHSAEDADVEGEEGEYYLWTEDEIMSLLPKDEADLVIRLFNVERDGNFEEESTRRKTGKNILHLKKTLSEVSQNLKMPLKVLKERLENSRKKLFAARDGRIRPGKDDKILTDWNGLMVVALAKASQVFNDVKYVDAAKRAVDFIFNNMRDSKGRLYHNYRDGEAAIPGFLDDYAFLTWGLLELYETTFETKYLQRAISVNEDMMKHFWDENQGGFYFTADDTESVLVRNKEIYDGPYPSGNSVAALNLLRISRMTAKPEYEEKSSQMLRAFSPVVSQVPTAHTSLMAALDFAIGPSYEVVIVGTQQNTKDMLNSLKRAFIPNKVVLFRSSVVERPEIVRFSEFTRDLSIREGKATAYVCHNYQCDLPTTSPEKMLRLLDAPV